MVGFTAEGLIWDSNGLPVQGLHHRHREHLLTSQAEGGEAVEFYVEAAANPIPPWHLSDWPYFGPDYSGSPLYRLQQAELAVVDRDIEALYLDLCLLLQLAEHRPSSAAEDALRSAAEMIDPADVAGSAAAARRRLRPVLAATSQSAARRDRDRARPHRHGLAVADPRDQAEMRPHLCQPAAAASSGTRSTASRVARRSNTSG